MKRILFLLLSGVMSLGLLAQSGLATAQSSDEEGRWADNPIWSGLWAGVNLDLDGQYPGPGDTTEEPTAPPTTPADPNEPTPTSPEPTTPAGPTYAILGDSVAAGVGLPALTNQTDEDQRCGRSSQAYGYQVARARTLEVSHIACGGAKAGDLTSQQNVAGGDMGPQLDAAFAGGTPELITITAGANDIAWDEYLYKCYTSTCGTRTDRRVTEGLIATVRWKLRNAMSDIQSRSGSNPPTTVLTGYYNPVSENCLNVQTEVTSAEIRWITRTHNALNNSIQQVANEYDFVVFAPLDFTGHDLCSDSPWIIGQGEPGALHPNARGQAAIARAVQNAL